MNDDEKQAVLQAFEQSAERLTEETRRHFDVAAENLRGDFRALIDGFQDLRDGMRSETQRLESKIEGGFEETQAMIRFSHAELDRRLRTLEQGYAELQARVGKLEQSVH